MLNFSTSLKRTSKRLACLASAALLLSSCATGTQPVTLPPKTLPAESCLVLAEPLPLLTDPSMAGMLRNHLAAANLYWELAARHACLERYERQR